MYREIRDCSSRLDALQEALRTALISTDTRDISNASIKAQALTVELLEILKRLVAGGGGEHDANSTFVQAAIADLNRAWESAEKVAAGGSPGDMRQYLVDFKTHADYARAYLRASTGNEDV